MPSRQGALLRYVSLILRDTEDRQVNSRYLFFIFSLECMGTQKGQVIPPLYLFNYRLLLVLNYDLVMIKI